MVGCQYRRMRRPLQDAGIGPRARKMLGQAGRDVSQIEWRAKAGLGTHANRHRGASMHRGETPCCDAHCRDCAAVHRAHCSIQHMPLHHCTTASLFTAPAFSLSSSPSHLISGAAFIHSTSTASLYLLSYLLHSPLSSLLLPGPSPLVRSRRSSPLARPS